MPVLIKTTVKALIKVPSIIVEILIKIIEILIKIYIQLHILMMEIAMRMDDMEFALVRIIIKIKKFRKNLRGCLKYILFLNFDSYDD
jgi:hypothetical protein